jgi:hypothetical protein
MARDGYGWWIERLRAAFRMTDIVRLDHFRAFAAYWAVPAGETTAVNGRWLPGPGRKFFNAKLIPAHKAAVHPKEGKKVLELLTPEQMKAIQRFCVDHAADSEQPATCG